MDRRAGDARRRTWNAADFAVVAAVLLPLVILAVVLATRFGSGYLAGGDNALNELRVHDLGHHAVLLGPYSRDGWSHPGPALYEFLVLGYRLLGSRSIGLYLTALAGNALAVSLLLVLSRRLGGRSLLIGNAVAIAVFLWHFSPALTGEPWNPTLTVLPFGAFIIGCWAAACGTRGMIPVVIGLASFCAQTHIQYVALTLPLLVWVAIVCVHSAVRRSVRPSRTELAIAVVVAVVLWTPPVLQQLTETRGNLGVLWTYFRNPPEAVHSVAAGYAVVAQVMGLGGSWFRPVNPSAFTVATIPAVTTVPWILLAFVAVAVPTLRRGHATERSLVGAFGVTIVAAAVGIARTPGPLIGYRLHWLPLVAVLAASATAWLAYRLLRRRTSAVHRLVIRAGVIVAVVALGVLTVANGRAAANLRNLATDGWVSADLLTAARASLPTDRQLVVTARGPFGAHTTPAAVLWLEGHGFDARVPATVATVPSTRPYDDAARTFGTHRICDAREAAVQLVIVQPPAPARVPGFRRIATLRERPGAPPWGLFSRPLSRPLREATCRTR